MGTLAEGEKTVLLEVTNPFLLLLQSDMQFCCTAEDRIFWNIPKMNSKQKLILNRRTWEGGGTGYVSWHISESTNANSGQSHNHMICNKFNNY